MSILEDKTMFKIGKSAYLLYIFNWGFPICFVILILWLSHFKFPNSLLGWIIYISIFGLTPLFISVTSILGFIRIKNTIINEDKIIQIRFVDTTTIEWKYVDKIEQKTNHTYWIYSGNKRVYITLYVYDNSEQLFNFITEKAKQSHVVITKI